MLCLLMLTVFLPGAEACLPAEAGVMGELWPDGRAGHLMGPSPPRLQPVGDKAALRPACPANWLNKQEDAGHRVTAVVQLCLPYSG
jgi:hypothetical protein